MRRFAICGAAFVALAACEPRVPDSGAGVGFQDYDSYQSSQAARNAELSGSGSRTTIAGPAPLEALPLDANGQPIISGGAEAQPVAGTVENAVGISNENSFEAVSSERSIEGDAARIAQSRAQYQVIEPTALPSRSDASGPNVVDFALSTTHPVGAERYSRSVFASDAKAARACAAYSSDDLAQAAFLARGGPDRDRLGLDPDGDGYACGWDPTPFRLVRAQTN